MFIIISGLMSLFKLMEYIYQNSYKQLLVVSIIQITNWYIWSH